MGSTKDKEAIADIQREVGAKIKQIRVDNLGITQDALGQVIPHLEGKNLQVRIASLERGNGSAGTIYTVMKHLYNQGVNINFLFGEQESPLRISKQVSLYPENITDYLKDVLVTAGNAKAMIQEIADSTDRVQNYVKRTVQMAEEEAKQNQGADTKEGRKLKGSK